MASRLTFLLLPLLLCLGCGRLGFGLWGDDTDVDPLDPQPWPPSSSPEDPGDDEEPDADVGPPVVPSADAGPPPSSDAGSGGPTDDAGAPQSDAGWPHDGGSRPRGDAGWPGPSGGGGGCDGECVGGLCWYLSDAGESCEDACRGHGGIDRRAATFIGTAAQGGSPEKCGRILRELGESKSVHTGRRSDGLGLGCHRWNDGEPWWLEDVPFDAADKKPEAERVCACDE